MDQITVSTSPLPDQVNALLQDGLKAAGTYLTVHGYASQNTWQTIAGLIVAAAPIVWSQIVTRLRAQQLAALAANPAVPQVQSK